MDGPKRKKKLKDSKLECYEVLSDDFDACHLWFKRKIFEEIPESGEDNFVTPQKLSHGEAFVHT